MNYVGTFNAFPHRRFSCFFSKEWSAVIQRRHLNSFDFGSWQGRRWLPLSEAKIPALAPEFAHGNSLVSKKWITDNQCVGGMTSRKLRSIMAGLCKQCQRLCVGNRFLGAKIGWRALGVGYESSEGDLPERAIRGDD